MKTKPIHVLLIILLKELYAISRKRLSHGGLCWVAGVLQIDNKINQIEEYTLLNYIRKKKPITLYLIFGRLMNGSWIFLGEHPIITSFYWVPGFKLPRMFWLLKRIFYEWIKIQFYKIFPENLEKKLAKKYLIKPFHLSRNIYLIPFLKKNNCLELFIQRMNEHLYKKAIKGVNHELYISAEQVCSEYFQRIRHRQFEPSFIEDMFDWDYEIVFWDEIIEKWRDICYQMKDYKKQF